MQTYNREKSISDIIDNTTKKLFKKKGFNIFQLIAEWENIIDKNYAQYTNPIAIRHIGEYKKILEIEVNNSGIIFDLQYGQETLLADINNFFQQEIVTELKLKLIEETPIENNQAKITPKKPISEVNPQLKSAIDLITDDTIKEQLFNIAQKFNLVCFQNMLY